MVYRSIFISLITTMKKGIISKVYPGNTHFTETLVRVLFQMRKDERKNPNLQSVVHTIYSDSGQQKLRDLPALKNDVSRSTLSDWYKRQGNKCMIQTALDVHDCLRTDNVGKLEFFLEQKCSFTVKCRSSMGRGREWKFVVVPLCEKLKTG